MSKSEPPAPPVAKKVSKTDTRHNITRNDEYAWMRDDNWQEVLQHPEKLRPDIFQHLEAENAYTDAVLKDSEALRAALYKEMRGRIKENDASPPVPKGRWAWFTSHVADGEHPQICRQDRNGKNPGIVLDGNEEASGLDYFKLGGTCANPQQTRLAWSFDAKGSEHYTIRIRDMLRQTDLPDRILNSSGSAAWSLDGRFIFYIQLDENHRPSRVMRHEIGTDTAEDAVVYEERDAGFFVTISQSRSGELIFVSAHDHETSEVRMIHASEPEAAPVLIAPRKAGLEYRVSHDAERQRLIVLTNRDAEDFRLMWADLASPGEWRELIPHEKGSLITEVAAYQNFIVWLCRERALPKIKILSVDSQEIAEVDFNEEAYDLHLEAGLEYETDICRFAYASMTTPKRIFDYDMSSGSRNIVYEQTVPSGHAPGDYVTRRLWAGSDDGKDIPVTLLYHKNTALDGTAPLLLYGYGAYGASIPAGFSGSRLSLVDRGMIYAIAHVRGGREMGSDWFLQGRRENKTNSFRDFAAAARALIEKGLVRKGNITLHGGSAGGLLVGATLNLAPDLFRGAVAEVPFVDVLNTMLDDSLPLTPPEWPEWGNPIDSGDDYRTIAGYAPYENIARTAYPHILATAGLTDPRVTYWEPAKWVARLRDRRTDDGLTLLRTEMSAGHGGKAGRFNQLEELALVYSFVLSIHGIRS